MFGIFLFSWFIGQPGAKISCTKLKHCLKWDFPSALVRGVMSEWSIRRPSSWSLFTDSPSLKQNKKTHKHKIHHNQILTNQVGHTFPSKKSLSNDNLCYRCVNKYYDFRVIHLLLDLSWVDFDFSYSTVCPVLLGLMGIWQKRLCSWWKMLEHPNQIQHNPSLRTDESPCICWENNQVEIQD